MKLDVKGLRVLYGELATLSNKEGRFTPQEERRSAAILSQISILKQGDVTLDELTLDEVNETSRAAGLPEIRREKKSETRAKAEAWQLAIKVMREKRTATETEGSIISRIGTYNGLGFFVPTEFVQEVYAAQAAHDAFLDENAVSFMNSTNGRVTQVPVYGDIEQVGVAVGESADTSSNEHLLSAPSQVNIAAYSYRSPLWRLSIETMQDVEAMGNAVNLFKKFAADRIARGAAKDLVNGNGSGKPLGIIPALLAAGVTPVAAQGSAANTGGSEDATNSAGSKDLAALYLSVNEAYRISPKCAWFMNDTTRLFLSQIVTKQGLPLVNYENGQGYIYNKPIRISPSMDNIGPGNHPILFGDGAYWLSRNVISEDDSYVQLIKEAAGLPEKGQVALRMWCRWDGVLLWNDAGSPAPFAVLANHT